MTTFYSSAKEVIAYTGVRPEALRCDSDAALESLLESWLVQIKSLIDADRGKTYDTDTPAGIHNIAMRIMRKYGCSDAVQGSITYRPG